MKIDYFTFNYSNSKGLSIKKFLLGFVMMLSVSFAYSQSEINITTTYNDSSLDWNMLISNPGTPPVWTAVGPGVNLTSPATNNPSFDLSLNTGTVTVNTTGTPANFAGVSLLQADFPLGLEITTIDVTDLPNLAVLSLSNNLLNTIDLTGNASLIYLNIAQNELTSIDLSQNPLLQNLLIGTNQDLSSLDISNNPNLTELKAKALLNLTTLDISNNPNLIDVDLEFTALTSDAIDDILINLDGFGESGGKLNLQNTGGVITKNGISAYLNLLSKGWTILPPQSFDYGDAPDTYQTTNANNGPVHIVGLVEDLRLGQISDKELEGIPTFEANGDDLNNALNDEDGVLSSEFDGITTSTTSVTISVEILNNATVSSFLHAWIDFDGNGTFDTDEYTTLGLGPNTGVQNFDLNWDLVGLGADVNAGKTYARFRITKDNDLTASDVGGYATGGEVEDYTLNIELDFDEDGIPDSSDIDDDNDGILDTVEDNGIVDRDTDSDGFPDRIDLDADGDGCNDVTEAGWIDGDDDGEIGTGPLVVDGDGKVISDANGPINDPADAYGPPNDLNVSGTPDFQEEGAAANITTQPVDQDLIIGDVTFTVVTDLAPGDENYQWEETTDDGLNWNPISDNPGEYAGATTASLVVTNTDVSRLLHRYRVVVSNIAYACDPVTTSDEVTYITPEDFDLDTIFDIVDVDDDNDGIFDVDESGNTDPGTNEDRINLDADSDGCFDVTEAGFTDVNGDGMLGDAPIAVNPDGSVSSGTDGYTPPNDLNGSGTPDFQEEGAAANITTQPVDQDLIIGDVTFTVVTDLAPGDENYQWEETTDDGLNWNPISDNPGEYAGATTASLVVTNTDVSRLLHRYRVVVSNIAYACDPVTTSDEVTYITPEDFDLDTIFDIVDVDDDNDGIFDVDESGNTDPGTNEDRINLDADSDGCFDVTEAGFTDVNGDGMLGDAPIAVNPDGSVSSGTDGYTPPNDLNGSGTPDFQEEGAAANITTQPVDQIYVLAGSSTFSVVTDMVPGDENYQWEESTDNGTTWVVLTDTGDYSGTTTADLVVSTPDFSKVSHRYRVLVNNIAYACDPVTTSIDATFITPGDFDKDLIFDVVDVDDDNDGILDVDEPGNTVPGTNPDATNLDADGDGCFDVTEAGFTDVNGDGQLGNFPITVDANGQVTSGTDGYTPPNDLNGSGTPDFQEAGAAATITTQPADQALIIGVTTFSVVATADTYQWEESIDGGANWVAISDGGDYAGANTSDLQVTNSDVSKLTYRYRVLVQNIGYACDPTTLSAEARYIVPSDFDNDGVFDIVDVDDDNDGILDVDEAGNTDPATNPDALNLDADGDGCFDVTEAGFTDNGAGMLGTASPPVVDATGLVTSAADGYTAPNDLDNNGTPDFQEAGAPAAITTQPVDQNFIPGTSVTFDVVASADTFQWEESTDGSTWAPVADGGNYSGALTASLTIANVDVSMLGYSYRVMVNNIAYACDPVTTSDVAAIISLPDNDNDGVPDIVDVDDDNDGILDTVEDNGVVDRDTDGNGTPDKFELDADADGCYDVTEAGFTDNGMGMLGTATPPVVDVNGQVTSATDGYTTPNDLDNNGTPDFQEAGDVANITGDPVDQDFILGGSATFTAASDGDTFQWEQSVDGVNWTVLTDDGKFSGTTTLSLTVSSLEIADYFFEYRVNTNNIAFACDPGDVSDSASYNILVDTDTDGVFDIVDVDDDNDGILDTVEGEVTDTNLDGRPDRISLDADSDGCADAIEAGFTDPDGDGILGTSPVTVDANGQVTGQGGYTTPNDLDNNGVFDFQEAGEPSSIENQPEEVEISLGDDAEFEVSATATFYQWQQSMDGGSSWSDLANDAKYSGVTTDRLRITDARGRLEGSWYRVVLSSPDFACDPVEELISEDVRLVFNTELIPSGFSPNGDGENDVFSVPGLIETPDFTMEVFDRWGNSVYKYLNNGNLNPDWWDGRSTGNMTLSKGQLVPAGTYFYLIEYNDGNKSPDKGWVYVNY